MTKIGRDNSNTEREIQSLIVWINHTENITLYFSKQKSKTHENTTQHKRNHCIYQLHTYGDRCRMVV